MNILHISTWDNAGGSGRSAYRIHSGLKKAGMKSRMLVGNRVTNDPNVALIGGRADFLDKITGKIVDKLNMQYLLYPSSFTLRFRTWFKEADIIQLYNTHGGYFSHSVLGDISRFRPVVWRLSDMWPMTGHCAYAYDCERWKSGCVKCPATAEYPALSFDVSAFLWNIKKKIYARSNVFLVAPSRWIAGLVAQSPLLKNFETFLIPNGLDTGIFRPLSKSQSRENLGISKENKTIFFNASSIKLERKGAEFLREAILRLRLRHKAGLEVIIAGNDGGDFLQRENGEHSLTITVLGSLTDDAAMAQAYSAADVFVLPTLAENLPNGILESMACGTPVVAFNTGGVPEAVRHMQSGYLARYRDAEDLAEGIDLLLSNDELRMKIAKNARYIAEREYSSGLQTDRFLDLYEKILARKSSHDLKKK